MDFDGLLICYSEALLLMMNHKSAWPFFLPQTLFSHVYKITKNRIVFLRKYQGLYNKEEHITHKDKSF